MNWLDIAVTVSAEAAEAVAEVLSRYVPDAIAIEQWARDPSTGSGRGIGSGPEWSADGPLEPDVSVHAYLPVDAEVDVKRQQIVEALWHLRQIVPFPEPRFSEVKPEDWENAWKEHYHIIRLGARFVVKPSWREYEPQPGDVILELDPGMAFGTGLHPTTQMCLSAIEQHMPRGARVLDLGTGSGILAIAAAKLGAGSVLALDIDPLAVEAARENVMRNRVEAVVRVAQGSLDEIAPAALDFAVVNILAKTIIQLCESGLAEKINPGATIVFAGLIDAQEGEVRETLERVGLVMIQRVQDKDWVGLVCRRPA
jgi:ribosomal protein L11 methyltransferase